MHDLSPTTALGTSKPRVDTFAGVTLTEMPNVALASVAARLGKESQTQTAVQKATGAPAPDVATFTGKTLTAFWTGPDQYMIEGPFETHEDIATQIKAVMKANASVTEQTDAWVRFDLSGVGSVAVLELLCAINSSKMTSGDASRTSIHHLGCFVLCRDRDDFSIYGPRSSAGSLHHAIHAAMKAVL